MAIGPRLGKRLPAAYIVPEDEKAIEDMIPFIPSLLFLFGEVRMRVPVPGRWVENISMEESKPTYILNLCLLSIVAENTGVDGS